MAKIVQMNTYRRKRGGKLKVPRQSRYLVALRFPRFIRDRRKTSSRIYAVTRAFIDEMGGFSLALGFTKVKMQSGEWHILAFPVASNRVREFLEAIDEECANGLVEVSVEGKIMGVA